MPKLTELPIGERMPERVHAVIEIPKASKNKFEYRPEWNAFFLDRILSRPLRFPTAYGEAANTMKGIVLLLLLLLAGCAQHAAVEGSRNEQEPDTAQIQRLQAEARALARTEGCTRPGQCRTAPIGDRPCGGPRGYLAYCANTTDTVALFRTLEQLRLAERERNSREGLVSTCEFRMPPETELVGTTCRAR